MPTANKPPVQGLHSTEIISSLDIDEPDVLRTLFSTKGDQWKSSFGRIIQMCGFSSPTDQEIYYHYEDDDFMRPIEVSGPIVTAGAGLGHLAFVVPLAATDVFTDAISGTHIFPRVNDVIRFPNNGTGTGTDREALITAVSPGTPSITAKLKNATDTVPVLASGDLIIITSGGSAEGTGQPEGTIRNVKKYSNKLQIIKESWKGTGTEMSNGKWIKQTSEGVDISMYYMYGQQQVDYMMQMKHDGALLWGQTTPATALVDPSASATGRFVQFTKGLIPEIKDRGTTIPYPIGAFDITKFNESAQVVEDNRGGGVMGVFYGFPLGIELEDLLVDYLDNTDIKYAVEGSGANYKKMVSIGFRGIIKADTVFLFKKLGTLSNTNTYSAAGFEDHVNIAVVIPIRKDMAFSDDQKKSMTEVPTFGERYKKLGSYNRKTETFEINGTGHNGKRILIAEDVDNLYTRSHIGFHGMAFNQMQLWQGE